MRTILSAIFVGTLVAACGASLPVPTQRMADAEQAERSARELGAANQVNAQPFLKLAQEQIAKAKTSVGQGDNQSAVMLLVRAKADAELAIALAREQRSLLEVKAADEKNGATK